MRTNVMVIIAMVWALIIVPGCQNSQGESKGKKTIAQSNKSAGSAKNTREIVASQRWYDPEKKLNHLVGESSPYLLSHADNPVDWYPWGDEALKRAKTEDKPIFLSVGYASCHWCHVMEHESFEDDSVAAMLNEHFISIKVDRERRPDVDQIYMTAVKAYTNGGGGWPMSVFMTPDLKPFFAGTYYPRNDRYGRPGFLTLLQRIIEAYEGNRSSLERQAEQLTATIRKNLAPLTTASAISATVFNDAISQSIRTVDFVYGGFGQSRKFPNTAKLHGFLRNYALTADEQSRKALEFTLRGLLFYGMYDQVGGGFHRYTVDRRWAVPHFEKMLYDNAMLVPVLLDAFLIFGDQDYLDGAINTLDFLLREMQDETGGFYSALDADSEGEEGKFYVFTEGELDALLGSQSTLYYKYYTVTAGGNFENNTNVMARKLNAWKELKNDPGASNIRAQLAAINTKILAERAKRIRPLTDDKVVTAWNGMALKAFARAYQVTGYQRFLNAAQKLGAFLSDQMFVDGELLHTYRAGAFSSGPLLEDYGYVADGMIDLYETDGDYRWLEFSHTLVRDGFEKFSDEKGSLYLSIAEAADLIVRPSDVYDGSYPSPGAYLISAAQRIGALMDDRTLEAQVAQSLDALATAMNRSPAGMMSSVLVHHNNTIVRVEFAIVGKSDSRNKFLKEVYQRYLPYRVIAFADAADDRVALLDQRNSLSLEQATGFVCQNYTCQIPTEELSEFRAQIDILIGDYLSGIRPTKY